MPPIPPHIKALLGLLATLLVPVAAIVQPPWGGLVALVAIACGLLSGVAVNVPTWIRGRPILRGSSVAALSPLVYFLAEAAVTAPDALERGGTLLGAVALAWLTGIPFPTPGQRAVAAHAATTAAAVGRTLKQE